MATILVNQTNGGFLQQYGYSTWTSLRNTAIALNVSLEDAQIKSTNSPVFKEINRVYLSFDTSSLSGLAITSLTLNIVVNYTQPVTSIMVLKSPTTNTTNLNTTHFNIYSSIVQYIDTPIYPTTNGSYTITLNNNAITNAITNGQLDLVLVDYTYDYLNVTPPNDNYTQITFNYHTVYLEYVVSVDIYPDSVTSYSKMNGVYSSSFGKVNGLFITP